MKSGDGDTDSMNGSMAYEHLGYTSVNCVCIGRRRSRNRLICRQVYRCVLSATKTRYGATLDSAEVCCIALRLLLWLSSNYDFLILAHQLYPVHISIRGYAHFTESEFAESRKVYLTLTLTLTASDIRGNGIRRRGRTLQQITNTIFTPQIHASAVSAIKILSIRGSLSVHQTRVL